MREWLPVAAVLPLLAAATAANAQMKDLMPVDSTRAKSPHVLDLRVTQEAGLNGRVTVTPGLILRQGVASNAFVGLSLANVYGRKVGSDLRTGARPPGSRRPALTFIMKF
jgi:hypothetical protein